MILPLMAIAVFVISLAPQTHANPDLSIAQATTSAKMPRVRADFPVPADKAQLFYVQRSMNSNTVVYAAQFDGQGMLKSRAPVRAYWRRFNTTSEVKSLKWFEDAFAYGVKARRTQDSTYKVRFQAIPELAVELRQTAPFQAALWAQVEDRELRLNYAYLDLDESGMIPRVTALRLFGTDPTSGLAHAYIITVSGGDFRK
jgi:hypothetical protein